MKRGIGAAMRPLWALWGLLAWAYALSQLVFMKGFFPPAAEAVLGARLPAALLGAALTAWAVGPFRGLAAGLAAAACLALSPDGGGGGKAALAAAVLAWAPFFAMPSPAGPERPPEGTEALPTAAAAVLVAAAWGLAARPSLSDFGALTALLLPIAVALAAGAGLPSLLRRPAAAGAAAWVLYRLLLAPLGMTGPVAFLLSFPAGLAATAWGAPRLRPRACAATAAAAALCGGAAAVGMERAPDWSHAVQGVVLLASWAAVWLLCRAEPALRVPVGGRAAAGAAALALGLFVSAREAGAGPASAFARAQSQDPAVRTLTRILVGADAHEALFRTLWSRMGRPDRPSTAPARELPALGKAPDPEPDVFILVVDSLRPDLLGAYGSTLGLTPALDAFAEDALVFTRAFTPFGGTHLAVPSLWAGSALSHGPLPVPFGPLNLLERLLEGSAYRKLVAPDVIAQSVTKGPPAWEMFDAAHPILRESCPALEDLAARLGPRGSPPVFAYAHLYDLHIAQVERDDFGRGGGTSSPRQPYERSLRALDACLGTFFSALKKSGRLESSIVVVTADHADSLGEEGRWGHAHTAFPEVLRIPLILRAPKPLRSGLAVDPASPALLTDLAPTLGRLLGRGPWPAGPGEGLPLLRAPGDAAGPEEVLVGSSYAPVFGLLREGGRRLFLADAVDRSFHEFILPERGAAQRLPLSDADAERLGKRLLDALRRLDAYREEKRSTQNSGKADRRT